MGKIIMVIIIILWVLDGIVGILIDRDETMLVNWFMLIYIVFIPFIPFIASWCGLY